MRGSIMAAALPLLTAMPAHANFPDKPIRLVIGSAAGSGPDIISRLLSDRLYRTWNQRIVVDPRPGVAGILSAEIVNRSAADGYTWMMLTSQLFIATLVYKDHKVNLARDFASVSLIGRVPFVLVVGPQLPVKTLSELVDLAKKSNPALRYGSAGAGGAEHLSALLFNRLAGVNMLHVPYKGVGQAIADVAAREVHLTYGVVPAAMPMVQAQRVRALGVSGEKRSPLLPDVPTIAETIPGYATYGWYGIVIPSGTPPDIIAKVSTEVQRAVKEPEFGEQLKNLGVEIAGSSRAELDKWRAEQTRRMAELVKLSGVDAK